MDSREEREGKKEAQVKALTHVGWRRALRARAAPARRPRANQACSAPCRPRVSLSRRHVIHSSLSVALLMATRLLATRRLSTSRMASSSIAAAVASAKPSNIALLAPQQGIAWSYEEFDLKARCLASGLEDVGYGPGTVAMCDVPNVAENLLLQCALSHVGASIASPPKDDKALEALCEQHNVRGIICADAAAPLPLSLPPGLLPAVYLDVADDVRPPAGSVAFGELIAHCPPRGSAPAATEDGILGIFGGAVLTQAAASALGASAAAKLGLGVEDRVCVSVTLMHAFGIG